MELVTMHIYFYPEGHGIIAVMIFWC